MQVGACIQDRRRPFGSEAVFVQICRHRFYAGHAQIELGNWIAELLRERPQISADTSIEMQPDIAIEHEPSDRFHGIDDSVGQRWSRGDQKNGTLRYVGGDGRNVGLKVAGEGYADRLQAEKMCRFVEDWMSRSRHQDFR